MILLNFELKCKSCRDMVNGISIENFRRINGKDLDDENGIIFKCLNCGNTEECL